MAFDWKSVVGTVAPTIATALGGPLAGVAVKALGEAVLGKPDATETEIQTAVAGMAPADLVKVKEAEMAFQTKMKELGVEVVRIDASDRASARAMAANDHITPRVLAVVIVGGFFALLGYMLAFGLPKGVGGSEAFILLLGALSAAFGAVMNFYFGSSASSRAKDDALARR